MGGARGEQQGCRQWPGEAGSGGAPGQQQTAAGQKKRQDAAEAGPAAGKPMVEMDDQPLEHEQHEQEVGDPATVEKRLQQVGSRSSRKGRTRVGGFVPRGDEGGKPDFDRRHGSA